MSDTRDRAADALQLIANGGKVCVEHRELALAHIDAITEHVVAEMLCHDVNIPAGESEIRFDAPAPMLVGAPDLKDVEDIITAAGCSATKTEAMMHLIENFRATALADELRRLVEARMPTVEHLQERFCFYDGHGQQSAINDARAYIRARLLGTDAAEGGE